MGASTHHVTISKFPIYGSRQAAADLLKYTCQYGQYEIGQQEFFRLTGGMAVGPHLLGFKNGKVIPGTTRGIKSFARTPSLIPISPGRFELAETATSTRFTSPVIAVGGKASGAFFHWIVEIVPRLVMTKDRFKDSLPLVLRPLLQRYQKDSIRIMDIPHIEVVEDAIEAPEIWFPSHMILSTGKGQMSPDLIRLSQQFADLAVSSRTLSRHRMYISRGDAPKRKVSNEKDVIALLERYGFHPVQLSDHSLSKQIELFRSAEAIVGPHGAGFASLVFCHPGTKVVELYAERFLAVSPFWNISSMAGLNYSMCLCTAPEPGKAGSYHNSDLNVDLDQLETALKDLGL